MGGRIGVDSEPGARLDVLVRGPAAEGAGRHASARSRDLDGGRLLLLSADPRLRLRLSMLLPNWGLRVSSVETTQEALDRLRAAANAGQAVGVFDRARRPGRHAQHRASPCIATSAAARVYGDLRLVCLYGEDPVADELQRSGHAAEPRRHPTRTCAPR